MKNITAKINRSLSIHGPGRTLIIIVSTLFHKIQNMTPARSQAIESQMYKDLEFDKKYGVDTADHVPQVSLDIQSDNQRYAVRYEPISDRNLSEALTGLRLHYRLSYEDYIFIDLGSGKGRAVLLASFFPFKKIVGIEFSDELNTIANKNITVYTGNMRCKNIELLSMDAVSFNYPENNPLVLYLFNPFDEPVMKQVINNLIASYQDTPRHIIVLYFNPVYSSLWDSVAFLRKKKNSDVVCVYDSRN